MIIVILFGYCVLEYFNMGGGIFGYVGWKKKWNIVKDLDNRNGFVLKLKWKCWCIVFKWYNCSYRLF